MSSYAALVCSELAPELAGVRVGQIQVSQPMAGQIQVQVRAAALNFPDLLMTEGGYQHKPSLPFVPGMEGAGIIVAINDSTETDFIVGDSVRFSSRSGACAQCINVDANRVWSLPKDFSFEQGAAFHVGAQTAWVSLVTRAALTAGETLLVHGATGGMGLAAVQLGVYLGATVIATGTDAGRLQAAKKVGAHHCIVTTDGFRKTVKDLTDQHGAHVVFDPVGGDVFDESLRAVAPQGRVMIVGFTSGRAAQLPTNIALIKELSVIGVRAGEFGRRDPARGREIERAVQRLADTGQMTPYIGGQYPLVDGLQAMQALRARAHPGKIVVTID